MFHNKEYGFEFFHEPERILDLGAYCGYAAVYLANRFPYAEIFSVEPSAENYRILLLNVTPYRNIKTVNGAAWSRSTQLDLQQRIGGHWGSRFGEAKNADNGHLTRAYSLSDLLHTAGWDRCDFIKCDIEGAEVEVFSDQKSKGILQSASTITVETHDRFQDGSTETVLNALPESNFSRNQTGEFLLFRQKDARFKAQSQLYPVYILKSAGSVLKVNLLNVNRAAWGSMAIDDETYQLHPNPPGSPPAEMSIIVEGHGGRMLRTGCRTDGHGSNNVIYSISSLYAGTPAIETKRIELAPGIVGELQMQLPVAEVTTIIFRTEMANTIGGNGGSWARWLSPRLD